MMLRFVLAVVVFIPIVLSFTEKKAAPPVSLADDELLKNHINDAENAAAFNKLLSHIANVNEERLSSIKKLASLQSVNPYPGLSEALRANIERDESESSESDSDSDDEKVVYLIISVNPYPDLSEALRSNIERDDSDSSESDSDSDDEKVVYLVIPADSTAFKPESPQTNLPENPPVAPPIARKVPDIPPQVPLLLPNNTNLIKIVSRTEPAEKPEKKKHKKHSEEQKGDSRRPQNETVNVSLNKDGWEFLRQSIMRSCKSKEVKKCRNACKDAVSSACAVYDCKKKLKKSLKKNCKRSCKDQFTDSW